MWLLHFNTLGALLWLLSQTSFALPSEAILNNLITRQTNTSSLAHTPNAPSHLGCFLNLPPSTSHTILTSSHLTVTQCATHCTTSPFFGISSDLHCSCYDAAPSGRLPDTRADDCDGKEGHTNIYTTLRARPQPVAGSFHHQGCYTDSRSHHSLTSKVVYDPAMTPSLCADICSAYPLFGVEYGTQCFCGRRLSKSAHLRGEGECAMRCGGNEEYTCGGSDRLNLYRTEGDDAPRGWNYKTVGPFEYKGCWTDSVKVRSLGVDGGRGEEMTLEGCAGLCDEGGYRYFGVEFGTQCFCGDLLGGARTRGRDCSELCAGSSEQLCGGAERLSVYERAEVGRAEY